MYEYSHASLQKIKEELGLSIVFTDHRKRAKRRALEILNAKTKKARVNPYKDLLKITEKTVVYAKSAICVLDSCTFHDIKDMALTMAIMRDFEELLSPYRKGYRSDQTESFFQ